MSDTIDYSQAERAVRALQGYVAKHAAAKQTDELISDEKQTVIWMVVATKKFSDTVKTKPYRIPLKHSVVAPDAEVCLITKDPQRTYKDLLQQKGVKRVSKVIGVTKLREKFKPYEAKRQLCASFDLFLADDRVVPLLPKLLGKVFFDKKKQPIPVNLTAGNLKNEIARAIQSTYMLLNSGTCISIKVGTTTLSPGQVRENIEAALPAVIGKIPKKWHNIQSIHLKTSTSTSLPIFNSLPEVTKTRSRGKVAAKKEDEDNDDDDAE